jgi:hypothetical protein
LPEVIAESSPSPNLVDAASSNLSEHARVAPLDATFEPAEPEEDDILKESEPKKWDEVAD